LLPGGNGQDGWGRGGVCVAQWWFGGGHGRWGGGHEVVVVGVSQWEGFVVCGWVVRWGCARCVFLSGVEKEALVAAWCESITACGQCVSDSVRQCRRQHSVSVCVCKA